VRGSLGNWWLIINDQCSSTRSAADYQTCADGLGPWMTKLGALDSRLSVGMTEANYLNAVGGAPSDAARGRSSRG
jgi:hypothetical protein